MGFLVGVTDMAKQDWSASFRRPKMATEEFRKMKAAYVAKHGYTMTVPGLTDIIKIGFDKPMTEGEVKAWKRKDWKYFTPERYDDIKKVKKRKKDKFTAMLASPTPHIVNNAGSIMTSIDNAQDCLGTLAFIGMLAIKAAPRILGGCLAGPVGWTMAAADMLNEMQRLGYKRLPGYASKRAQWQAEHASTKSKKARVLKAAKTMKWMPGQGRIIEAAQVMDNVFGIGLCLGPIVGFAIEAVTGPMRRITGAKVNVKMPWLEIEPWTGWAQKNLFSDPVYFGSGLQTDDEEVMQMMMASYLARQEINVGMEGWNALDNVENINEIEKLAPYPTNVLTLEVIDESGVNLDDYIGWPHSSKPWALLTDVVNELDQPCQQFQKDYIELHKKDWWSYAFGALSNEATFQTFAIAEGEENVTYDFNALARTAGILSHFRICPDIDTPEAKMQEFADQVDIWDKMDIKPTLRVIEEYCGRTGISLVPFA